MLRILLLSVLWASAFAQISSELKIGVDGVASVTANSTNVVVKVDPLGLQENVVLNPLALHLSSNYTNGTLDSARPYGDLNTSFASGGIGLNPATGFIEVAGFNGAIGGTPAKGQIGGNGTQGQISQDPLNGTIGTGNAGGGISGDPLEGFVKTPVAEGGAGPGGLLPVHGSTESDVAKGSMVAGQPENAFNGSLVVPNVAGAKLVISKNESVVELGSA